jgi:hypothetical protein
MNMHNEPFRRNPEDVTDFDLKTEIINLSNQFHALDHRLEQFYEIINSNNVKLELLEEAASKSIYLPYLKASPRYDHKSNNLILGKRLVIPFKKKEAELLSKMFTKSGKQKKGKFYFSEVRDDLNIERKKLSDTPATNKSLHSTITRIQTSLELEYRAGGILTITSTEFYFNLI